MKLTIEFDLWEEQEEFKQWFHGVEYRAGLDEFQNWMRRLQDHECSDSELVLRERYWDKFHEIFGELLK